MTDLRKMLKLPPYIETMGRHPKNGQIEAMWLVRCHLCDSPVGYVDYKAKDKQAYCMMHSVEEIKNAMRHVIM